MSVLDKVCSRLQQETTLCRFYGLNNSCYPFRFDIDKHYEIVQFYSNVEF